MADKKISITDKIFLIILLCELLAVSGCASQARQMPQMDSNHYRVQAQQEQDYPCPECGFPIPDKEVSPNTRTENKCPDCREIFFGKPTVKSKSNKQQDQGKSYQGPKVFVRGYHHDIKHDGNTEYSVKNNWDVSDDGNSGSISSTTIITHEHNVKGEHGRTTGAGGLGRCGGY